MIFRFFLRNADCQYAIAMKAVYFALDFSPSLAYKYIGQFSCSLSVATGYRHFLLFDATVYFCYPERSLSQLNVEPNKEEGVP